MTKQYLILKTENILLTQISTEKAGRCKLNTKSFTEIICEQPVYFSNDIWFNYFTNILAEENYKRLKDLFWLVRKKMDILPVDVYIFTP